MSRFFFLESVLKATCDKVDKVGVVGFEYLGERLGADAALLVHFGVEGTRGVLRVEEELATRGLGQDVSGRRVDHLHDHGQLLGLVLTGKDRIAREQFDQYATE